MGYYTTFGIKVTRLDGQEEPSFEKLRKKGEAWHNNDSADRSIYNDAYLATMDAAAKAYACLTPNEWDSFNYAFAGESLKFYDWEKVLKKLSVTYSDFLFYVTWNGEESGDFGHAEFKAGKMRQAKAVLPPLPEKWT